MQQFTNANQIMPNLNELYGRRNLADLSRYSSVLNAFRRIYGYNSAYLCSSSGRVEFVGNHLDHNGGCVLACTVSMDVVVAFRPNERGTVRIVGKDRGTIRLDINNTAKVGGSAGLVKGVVEYLKSNGYAVGGFDAYTESTIPSGAGVSSSAAFETAVATIISESFNNGAIPSEIIARAGQFAENEYFNKACGLLDQSVIAVGGVVALDFKDGLSYRRVNADFNKLSLALIDTGASHAFLSTQYSAIPAEMKAVAAYFGCQRLIEVDENAFFARYDDIVSNVGLRPALRAKHFFEENARVIATQQALEAGDVAKVIELVNASGDSSMYQLQNCAVNDSDTTIADIVSTARSICPCGARVHGGGFAGTVLCVVPTEYFANFLSQATAIYGANRVHALRLRNVGTRVL